eukprot:6592486-Prymnesium_polylepis.1
MLGVPPLTAKAQPRLCLAWAQSRRRNHKYPTALLPPRVQCEQRCQNFSCVAVTVGAAEEAETRAAAWPGTAGMSA